ncbi:MAG: 5-(carboxyamino)imidazole ribonucleotide synthase [Wenzhouxiangella sp.]
MHVGILGAGQLARMMAEAGGPLGLSFSFLDPSPDACAGELGRLHVGPWDDPLGLQALAECDRITADFENVPAQVLAQLAGRVAVRPPARAFAAGQDRLEEKQLLQALGIPVAPVAAVRTRPDLLAAVERIGLPAVLKTRRLGYDGKGQAVLTCHEDLEPAWQRLGGQELILEGWIDFDFECAQTAVRSAGGEVRCYPLSRTIHRDGILRLAAAPAGISEDLAAQAKTAVTTLLEELDYVGCLTLELFAAGSELIANEYAPRPHNSAHWTIEGAVTSQFENHLRAVCDLPLGSTAARGVSLMLNWLGAMPEREKLLAVPGLAWHDYHKQARPGRKVGHATLVAADRAALSEALVTLKPLLDRDTAGLLRRLG